MWRRLLGPFAPLVAVAVILGVVIAIGIAIRFAFVTSPDQAATNRAPRIHDTAFEQAATTVCKRYVTLFDTETTLGKTPSNAESAAFLASIAASFDRMVGELRSLPVAAADRPAVDAWLGQWNEYDAYGHQFAAAVAQGAEGPLVAHDKNRIDGLQRDRNGFARANHMSACAFS